MHSTLQPDPGLPRIQAAVRMLEDCPGIVDRRVLDALSRIPRDLFVPPDLAAEAFGNHPLPIGFGQTISQPYIVAWMLQWLGIRAGDRALEIGTGSGYQAALLSLLCREVHSVEIIPELAATAEQRLQTLGLHNVHTHVGDGSAGWPDAGPFDVIVSGCAAPEIPGEVIDQLADGGRLVAPIGPTGGPQQLFRYRRQGSRILVDAGPPVRFVPWVGSRKDGGSGS